MEYIEYLGLGCWFRQHIRSHHCFYFHGALEQLHQNSLKIVSAAGVKVSVKLRHVTVSRPQPPAQPDCFNLYLDSAAYDRDGQPWPLWPVCARPFPQPGHICHRVFTKINIVRAAASWAKVPVYYSNVPAQSRHQMVITRSFLIPAN